MTIGPVCCQSCQRYGEMSQVFDHVKRGRAKQAHFLDRSAVGFAGSALQSRFRAAGGGTDAPIPYGSKL